MKIIMYAVLDVERPFIKQWAAKHNVEIKCVTERLTPETVKWADGYDGIDFQQTHMLDDSIYPTLKKMGFKQLTARMVGLDMVNVRMA